MSLTITRQNEMTAVVCTRFGDPDNLRVGRVARRSPGAGQLLIRNRYSAITASDCNLRGQKIPIWHPIGLVMRLALGFVRPRQPVLGLVFCGDVEAVGQGVTQFAPGDRVYGMTGFSMGAYAELVTVPETGVVSKIPGGTPYHTAAAAAYGGLMGGHFMYKEPVRHARRVLVYGGSGAIGSAAIQIARANGSHVTAVSSTRNLELLRTLGAHDVMDYTRQDTPAADERFDVVFDAVGNAKRSALKTACRRRVARGGRYLSVDSQTPIATRENLARINGLLADGRFTPVIDRTYPIERIAEAHRYVDLGHKIGNVLLAISDGDVESRAS